MSEFLTSTTEQQSPSVSPEPAALPTDSAALRAELAELLRRDLLSRFTTAGPRDHMLVETVAGLAADLAHLTKMLRPGCDSRVPPLLLGGIERVARGLCILGTDRIAGTHAETILSAAIAIEGAALALMPAAGNA
jgi:hypothetical protein